MGGGTRTGIDINIWHAFLHETTTTSGPVASSSAPTAGGDPAAPGPAASTLAQQALDNLVEIILQAMKFACATIACQSTTPYHLPTGSGSPDYHDQACHQQGPARCAVYVKRELLQAEVPVADLVSGPFECCAVRIRLEGAPPWEFLLCEYVNAHHPAWGGHRTDPRGREVRDVLQHLGLVILNTGADTFVCRGRQATSTAIELSVATEGCRYSWSPLPDTWGSDHLPILLSPLPRQGPPIPRVSRGGLADLPAAVPAGHRGQGPPATGG
ncbi:hypothetical protein MTO96_030343 [Rhipicephalus appendiculatus]